MIQFQVFSSFVHPISISLRQVWTIGKEKLKVSSVVNRRTRLQFVER